MDRAELRCRAAAGCALLLLVLVARPLAAVLCSVPSPSHPTLGAAVRDVACTAIQLAGGTFPENLEVTRDLAIAGTGSATSTVAGALVVSGAGTDVSLTGLAIDGTAAAVAGCWPSVLSATGGAHVESNDDVEIANSGIANGGCRLFADGFESGGTLAWSARQP